MDIFSAIIILIGSLLLLIWGGDKFVDASIAISKKLKIPPAIVGATITSIGTTLPELLVTIFASSGESSGLAVGNALGSIAFNGAVIGGILLIFSTIRLKDTGKTSSILLIFSLFLTFAMCLDKNVAIWECCILIIMFVIFMVLNYKTAKQATDDVQYNIEKINKSIGTYLVQFLISSSAIAVGAYFLVDKAKFLAGMAGLSETLIGLTIVSIGTSLPELITTINSIRKKQSGLGLGNIIGSNIINCTLLMSLSGIISSGGNGLMVDNQTLFVTLPIATIICLILLLPTLIKKKSKKWQGITLICLYLAYYTFLILNGTGVIYF